MFPPLSDKAKKQIDKLGNNGYKIKFNFIHPTLLQKLLGLTLTVRIAFYFFFTEGRSFTQVL